MRVFISTDSEGSVLGWSSNKGLDTDVELDILDTHEVLIRPFVYKYIDGVLVKDSVREMEICREGAIRKVKQRAESALATFDKLSMKYLGMQRVGRLNPQRASEWNIVEDKKQVIRDNSNTYEQLIVSADNINDIKTIIDGIDY
jgi:hypothetical protein